MLRAKAAVYAPPPSPSPAFTRLVKDLQAAPPQQPLSTPICPRQALSSTETSPPSLSTELHLLIIFLPGPSLCPIPPQHQYPFPFPHYHIRRQLAAIPVLSVKIRETLREWESEYAIRHDLLFCSAYQRLLPQSRFTQQMIDGLHKDNQEHNRKYIYTQCRFCIQCGSQPLTWANRGKDDYFKYLFTVRWEVS